MKGACCHLSGEGCMFSVEGACCLSKRACCLVKDAWCLLSCACCLLKDALCLGNVTTWKVLVSLLPVEGKSGSVRGACCLFSGPCFLF